MKNLKLITKRSQIPEGMLVPTDLPVVLDVTARRFYKLSSKSFPLENIDGYVKDIPRTVVTRADWALYRMLGHLTGCKGGPEVVKRNWLKHFESKELVSNNSLNFLKNWKALSIGNWLNLWPALTKDLDESCTIDNLDMYDRTTETRTLTVTSGTDLMDQWTVDAKFLVLSPLGAFRAVVTFVAKAENGLIVNVNCMGRETDLQDGIMYPFN